MPKEYEIGSYKIMLPDDHQLDHYQSVYPRYDICLGYISQFAALKYQNLTVIDVGANVGDSAALIQKYQSIPTLCIEGNPEFLEYLEHNAEVIGNIQIEDCFIGKDGESVDLSKVWMQGGTASIVNAVNSDGFFYVNMKSLETILEGHPSFRNFKLIKSDTDGFDFSIIKQSKEILQVNKPIIYFEYSTLFHLSAYTESLEAITVLIECGYTKFLVYDNFGNYVISLEDDLEKFIDLTTFLFSNLRCNGRAAVYYLDICAFTNEDLDLFESIREKELELIQVTLSR
ncbi:MAG: FkbM family methyltransferase [Synechococcales bacterium]|nr:FkbM family methyltransferase [Synechococcales bacterium]